MDVTLIISIDYNTETEIKMREEKQQDIALEWRISYFLGCGKVKKKIMIKSIKILRDEIRDVEERKR